MISPELVLSSLKLLFDVYVFRTKSSSEKSPVQTTAPAETTAQPNPERLQELIEEIEQGDPTPSTQALTKAIDSKFPPEQAEQVKSDLTALAALSSPPNFADYDYYGLFSQYVRAVRDIAIRTELFKLRGSKDSSRTLRRLPMPSTGRTLIPYQAHRFAVTRYGDIASASITSTDAILTDATTNTPMVIIVRAEFTHASYGVYCGTEREQRAQVYNIERGEDTNWFTFSFLNRNSGELGFGEFGYRLTAANAKSIINALKQDISDYLREIEEEKPIVRELAEELAAMLAISQPAAKS